MADHFSPQQAEFSSQLLPQLVEQLINSLCQKFNKPPLQPFTRQLLSNLKEENSVNVLREILRRHGDIGSLDVLIIQSADKFTSNASTAPTSSTTSRFSQRLSDITPTRLMNNPSFESTSVQKPVQMQVEEGSSNGITPQLIALGELQFRKAFMILNYIRGKRLEEVVSAEQMQLWKNLPMEKFESQVWSDIGVRNINMRDGDRCKSVDWNSGAAHLYNCRVSPDGTYKFEGPFLGSGRNFLQRTLGDDNVLMVNFGEVMDHKNSCGYSPECCYQLYKRFLKEGILVGLRRYYFFVFKNGGKEEKKKDPTSSCVKCFFVRMESASYTDSLDYILTGKTIRQARCIFMHLDTLEKSLSHYMARFSLILSKTLNLEIDLSCVEVQEIPDIKCQDEHGKLVEDSILTDGTGFISEDLAVKCPKSIFKGSKKAHNTEKFSESRLNESPLLIQFRLFNKGSAVKGTLLINKKLPPKTIQVRPSMIKVERNPNLSDIPTSNSLEVVGISNRPKQAYLSKTLILLLSYGGVPQEFFMNSLCNALEDSKGALVSKRKALRVALNNAMDDNDVAKNMILSGIPLEESFLHYHLAKLMMEEKKGMRAGKIPVAESYYLMGTTDPTGVLEEGEVCVILDNGQISGKVLVYRNPGLHFGDIHILNATYVHCLEDFVGNAKYAIFFPCKGRRSIADEIAGGDYDGDMYFVSRNPELLGKYTEADRWVSSSPVTNNPKKKPGEFSDEELEEELFKLFLDTSFKSSNIVGIAADSWIAVMDRFVTLGPDRAEEKRHMKDTMCRLIDIYYDALDAAKSGKTVELPKDLKAELFPHYMEKSEHISYKSTSIMGLIYDKVMSELENLPEKEIWKLPSFRDPPQQCVNKWRELYKEYRGEMRSACHLTKNLKNVECERIMKKYRKMLYGAEELRNRRRDMEEICNEACAIYEIVYEYVVNKREWHPDSRKEETCGFAWRVAGEALCCHYIISHKEEEPMICSKSALKEIF